jgi:MoaA/NifB/PqqE/SkfB family radical SAM enzyme
MAVFVMMRENYEELPAYIDLAHQLGIGQVIAKHLDVILKQEDDTRRLFSHDGQPHQVNLEPVLAEARQRAAKLGVGLRLYAVQPQELAMCEQNPLRNLFFSWAGYVSPCITLSYAENRVFNGQQQVVPCQRFGNIKDEPLEQIWQKVAYQAFRRPFEARVRLERQATINALIGNGEEQPGEKPKAPDGCQSCYYLYGI